MTIAIHIGDCLDVLRGMPDASVDSVVTDPPYGLSFMGKTWDYDVPSVEIWAECLRVLKPGGHLLAFAGTRTQHRMAVRIEDAGFEIRDMIAWVYGSGFPKSLDVSKAIEAKILTGGSAPKNIRMRDMGDEYRPHELAGTPGYGDGRMSRGADTDRDYRATPKVTTPGAMQWQGWGTALKPALEPITVARKPLAGTVAENVLQWGVGAINIDGCRVTDGSETGREKPKYEANFGNAVFGKGMGGGDWENTQGRWPANLIHDGSGDVLAGFPSSGPSKSRTGKRTGTYGEFAGQDDVVMGHDDEGGSAARFFYCAKASKADRDDGLGHVTKQITDDGRQTPIDNPYLRGKTERHNSHPTVKPTDLMRYLCRLVTPPGGVVLDPFMGSGSTGKAAHLEQFSFIGIEIDPKWEAIARARITGDAPLFAEVFEEKAL